MGCIALILGLLFASFYYEFAECFTVFVPRSSTSPKTHVHPFFQSSSPNSESSSSNESSSPSNEGLNKYLTTAERERRAESKRRKERKGDVVIGKTSALPDAVNFEIDVRDTERQLYESSDKLEQEVRRLSDLGLTSLKMGDLESAKDSFDQVFALKPTVYLWQAGLALYYLGDVHKAAESFTNNAHIFEGRFGEQASEERIWRDACELRL